jgi:predicted CXXCH cytochrome family protein
VARIVDVYDDDEAAETVHGSSSFEVSVTAEYASEETTRLAGECQSCHNPMGSDNGDGVPIAKLAELEGRELCYSCHKENDDGITDMASYGVFPEAIAGEPELVVAWDPENLPAAYGGLHVYTRAFGDETAPYDLEGPRRYRPITGSTPRTGAIAYGDLDGSDENALVVADPGAPVLRVFRYDPLAGLKMEFSVGTDEIVVALEVGDFIVNGDGLPEVAVLLVAPNGDSTVRLYRHNGSEVAPSLMPVGDAVAVGSDATGFASGYVTGGETADLVVTSRGLTPDVSGELRIVSWNGSAPANVDGPFTTLRGPRGPSVGPVLPGDEVGIVVANSEETSNTISVFDADGAFVSYEAVIAGSDAVAWDTAAGAFLPGGDSGVAVALRSESEENGVALFEIGASGLTQFQLPVQTGVAAVSSALTVGDVDGSGEQLVVANAGRLSHTAGESVSPSVMTLPSDGSNLTVGETRWAGGAEMAGGTPALAVADLGPVGRSRHPASAIEGAHVSTETVGFERHAECVDCHNTHALTSAPRTADAPNVYGVITGAWGLDLESTEPTLAAPADFEYQVCFKCHASASWGDSPRDIASEFDSESAHPVIGGDALLYCVDCHGNAGPGPEGPHVSPAAPLLASPLIGIRSGDDAMLCYGQCHAKSLYHDGAPPASGTDFRHAEVNLHALHVQASGGHALGCESCHASHGSQNEHLVREELEWEKSLTGGECSTTCHTWETYAYSRSGSVWAGQTSGTTAILYDVHSVGPSTAWTVGAAGTILATVDGGETWSPQTFPVAPTRQLNGVHFADAAIGWAVGNNGTIINTMNGGSVWNAQISDTTQALNSVSFVSDTTGWVVGGNGQIRATVDSGNTWTTQASGTPQALNGVSFVSPTTGWAVGNGGIIRATTNGGATWSVQTSGTGANLNGVHFVNPTTGWAVGNDGIIRATTNGGATWSVQTSGTGANLNGVHFVSPTTGWAVGAGGIILHTTNGGTTWTAQASGVTTALNAVHHVNFRTGWAVGAGGVVRHYNVVP